MAGFVQGTSGQTGSGTSITSAAFGSQPTAGNMIVVGVAGSDGVNAHLTSVTDSAGNTYTDNGGTASTTSNKLFYAYNITTTASFTVTANSSATQQIVVVAQEFNGVPTTNPIDAGKNSSGNATSTALDSGTTATLSQADEIVVGFGSIPNNGTLSLGSGYTNLTSDVSTSVRAGIESKVVASTTGVSATETAGTSGDWIMLVQTFLISSLTTSTSSTSSSTSTSISTSSTSISSTSSSTSKSTSTSSTSKSTSTSSTSKSTSTSSTSRSTSTSSTSRSTSTSSTSNSTSQSTSTSASTSLSTSSTSSSTSISTSTSLSTSVSTSSSTSTTTSIMALDIRPHGSIPRFH